MSYPHSETTTSPDSAVVRKKHHAGRFIVPRTALTPTPFDANQNTPVVFVASGGGPYANTRAALAGVDLSPAAGRRVLLKPNAGRVVAIGAGVTTHPEVLAAAIDAFREAGADVAVGESPITGVKTLDAFAQCGIKAVADERNCPLLDMDERASIPVRIPGGVAIDQLKVCPEALEFDVVVSVPVMKTHMHTGVTLSVKNMKGCLWRRSKVELHMLPKNLDIDEKPLDIAIADMASVLLPHLAIIDGTIGMEGLGPSAGTPKGLDTVVVGVDPFAADATACALMGIAACDIPHLRMGAERGLGIIDMERIRVLPENWRDARQAFALPPTNLSLEFPNVAIFDAQSCSACQASLLLFLRRHGEQLFGGKGDAEKTPIAIGKGHESVPPGTLCVGNCTAKHRKENPFVPGCPPVASEILNVYNEYFK